MRRPRRIGSRGSKRIMSWCPKRNGFFRITWAPEEVKKSRFSPRLIRSLRKSLGITQKELSILTGVTVGAAHKWEIGKFKPKDEKKAVMVGLRKLGRREVRKLLEERPN